MSERMTDERFAEIRREREHLLDCYSDPAHIVATQGEWPPLSAVREFCEEYAPELYDALRVEREMVKDLAYWLAQALPGAVMNAARGYDALEPCAEKVAEQIAKAEAEALKRLEAK